MWPVASGMRAVASAAPSSNSAARVSSAGASSSSARRRKRTAWSAAPRSPARRAASVSASNAQRSPAGGVPRRWTAARSHRAGSRASSRAAERCSCACSAGGIESASACWMIGCRNRGGSARCSSSASISWSTARAVASRSRPATDAVSASDASSPRIASARATAATAGGRCRSRADTKRATDGGPIAATAPPPRLVRLDTALPQGGDELAGEQRVAGRGLGAGGADLVAHVVAEAGADERRNGGRAERRRPDRGARLALDHPGQGLRGRLAGPYCEDRARGQLLEPRLQVGEEAQRGLIGPVRVVDEQGERDGLGEPRTQPVQAVEAREEALVGRRAVGDVLEQRARQPGRAGEQLLAHRGRRAARCSAPAAVSPRRTRTLSP